MDAAGGRVRETTMSEIRISLIWTVAATVFLAAPPLARPQASTAAAPIEGKLVQSAKGPALRVKGRDIPLSTVRTWHLNALRDTRLAGREIRVEGEWSADGTFKVSQFFTVKSGKLYRVRYYCEVCNIESLEPGDCVCCQAPTELQEIPVNK